MKTIKKGMGICFLAHNTFGDKGVCWSFGMGTMTSDNQVNYSHELAQTKQQVG
jgi:hypothetical protein